MKYLIVNADDFGLNSEINVGIIKGHQKGIISSTSLMCSAPAFEQAVTYARANPKLGIGIHLTLVGGVAPVLSSAKLTTLLDENGLFYRDYGAFLCKYLGKQIKKAEIKAELAAQIEKALQTGLTITHVDSHQHLHVFPGLTEIITDLCVAYDLRKVRLPAENIFWRGACQASSLRWVARGGLTACASVAKRKFRQAGLAYPEHFFGMLAGGHLDENCLNAILSNLPEGVSEIMTHPGLHEAVLRKTFAWGYDWESELTAMLSPRTIDKLYKN
ncbi:MAG TPA: ChbG/HpnK family deacetylase, partial [Candidatus Avacidaminococcus intestinavium]|nr:ChbG/HpnK family deacetylase [Candidatus Avacidaminococcus intestinavium]